MTLADDTTLVLQRSFRAPAARVFRAWTDPASLRCWFMAGDTFENILAETDLRVGGAFRLAMRDPKGEDHCATGVYREIVPDRRLVFTWAWASTPERESLVTIELTPHGDRTDMVMTHARFADAETRDRHEDGWTACLAMLARLLDDAA